MNAAREQQAEREKPETRRHQVHRLARRAAQEVDQQIHRNMLVPVKSLDAADERDVNEEKTRPFFAGRKT